MITNPNLVDPVLMARVASQSGSTYPLIKTTIVLTMLSRRYI